MMDLANFDLASDAEAGTTFHLANPRNGQPLFQEDGTPITIGIKGVDSPTFRAKAREQAARRRDMNSSGVGPEITEEFVTRETVELLATCTFEWSGIVCDGQPVEFSTEAAERLYSRFFWMREQADAACSNRNLYGRPVPQPQPSADQAAHA
ncbi:hypothetical protein LRS73_35420 (plasmid) [Methylobacterium currus]|uniref:hypothetical protein n=1 Tax=Methylobacterium currus TaxID=2051553 RepID=UPI001E2C2A88|nr:hypothetical protein [Methylobacterium currus]UHC20469.1 hypothetical protein LRS73_35420 [Methylobacterium currus]